MGRLCSGLLYCRIRAFQQALGYFGARHYCRSWFHTITTSYRYPNIGNFVQYFALVSTQRERRVMKKERRDWSIDQSAIAALTVMSP